MLKYYLKVYFMTSLSENDDYKNDTITKWEELPNLKKELLRGIYSYGYETPSPIQQKGIIPLINKVENIATNIATDGNIQII